MVKEMKEVAKICWWFLLRLLALSGTRAKFSWSRTCS